MAGKKFCYEMIKEYIIDNIQKNQYPTGKIESENQLCQKFSTTRMTVRQALIALQDEGYIYTIPKKGSFISQKKLIKQLDGLRSFTEDMMGNSYSKIILLECIDNPIKQIDSKMVWYIQRIRYCNDQAIAYEEGYFNAEIIKQLPQSVVENSIYDYIEKMLNYELSYAQQEISAVNNLNASSKLKVKEKTPLLKIRQTTYTKDDQCIEVCDTYYLCEYYTFKQNAYRRK